jgi:hypothetical protein
MTNMTNREKLLFRVRPTWDTQRVYGVFLWGGYGVVVPDLWTTNGSHHRVAELVYERLEVGEFTIEDSVLPDGSFSSQEALAKALEVVRFSDKDATP